MSIADEDFQPLREMRCRLKLNAAERSIYERVINDVPPKWFVAADEPAIASYARLMARIDRAEAQVAALDSESVHTSHGPALHPLVMQLDRLQRRAAAMREELRLNPASRRKAIRTTKLGRARAEAVVNAQEIGRDITPADRAHLMFGGRRAAEALGLDDD